MLADADAHVQLRGGAALDLEGARDPVEVAARIQRDALGLRDLDARRGRLERRVPELEHQADRPVRQHARGHEVARYGRLVVRPDRGATAAARRLHRIEVGAVAVVAVVVVGHVPLVDDEAVGALDPDVDAAGGEGLFLPDLQVGAVHAVGDAVVLPGEVVVALAHEAAVSLVGVARRRLPGAGLDAEALALLRGERGLEDQLVGRIVAVAVDQL